MRRRWVVWQAPDEPGMEVTQVELSSGSLNASGHAIGTDPEPYRLTYELATGPAYVTVRMLVTTEGPSGRRALELRRSDDGEWSANGRPVAGVDGALDCDLGRCPLTNTMPVLRHGLHRAGGPTDFVMAWISVPDLAVTASEQRYTFLHRHGQGSVVRYEGRHRSFVGDLDLDDDGLVVHYPGLATRVWPPRPLEPGPGGGGGLVS